MSTARRRENHMVHWEMVIGKQRAGVINGNYRCALSGHDMNRRWARPMQTEHAPIFHLKNMIQELQRDRGVVLFCDMHGHSRKKGVFVYGCDPSKRETPPEDPRPLEKVFPWMVSQDCQHFAIRRCTYKVGKSKAGTGRVVTWKHLGVDNSYTMEASFCGSDSGPAAGLHFDVPALENMGEAVARAILRQFGRGCARQVDAVLKLIVTSANKPDSDDDSDDDSDSSSDDEVARPPPTPHHGDVALPDDLLCPLAAEEEGAREEGGAGGAQEQGEEERVEEARVERVEAEVVQPAEAPPPERAPLERPTRSPAIRPRTMRAPSPIPAGKKERAPSPSQAMEPAPEDVVVPTRPRTAGVMSRGLRSGASLMLGVAFESVLLPGGGMVGSAGRDGLQESPSKMKSALSRMIREK
ncbi:hypothetical protein T484DRAFT_1894477, partial [Baffinella frigidus]